MSPLAHRTRMIGRDMNESSHRGAAKALSPLAQEVMGEDEEQDELLGEDDAEEGGEEEGRDEAAGAADAELDVEAEADDAARAGEQAAGEDSVLQPEAEEGDAFGSDDDFVDDGASNGSDADFELSPLRKKPSPLKKVLALDAHTPVSTPKTRADKENDAPGSGASAATDGTGGDELDEVDEFGLDKSMVIRSGSKTKKSKRCARLPFALSLPLR